MRISSLVDRRAILRGMQRWPYFGLFLLGAVATGLVAVIYARLVDFGYDIFLRITAHAWWISLLVTPSVAALGVWITRRWFPGSEGSGIPQVIATRHAVRELGPRLLTIRILIGKIAVSFLAVLGGFAIGREGPTIHVGAALMFSLRRLYPARLRAVYGIGFEQKLALAGAAAGLSAAFNAPLAGVVFAIEELSRSFEQRTSGVLITAIIFAGIVSLALQGNYVYFGTIAIDGEFPNRLAVAVVILGVTTGVAGGVFCRILLDVEHWMPRRLLALRQERPVVFGAVCGLFVAALGVCSRGHLFGSGYAEAQNMLEGHSQLGPTYPLLKMASVVGSYLPGTPGGIFAPSLAIGAGMGNALHSVFGQMQLPMLIALGMVGYLAAVTQSPITAFVIVIEMINGHALVISLMATALISSHFSKLFAPPLYEALAQRYLGR
ncbi:chloride channel protein [Cupriavidus sp. TMH.W2]|uniref:chloride channel protein n=1 Tax=Cupriavidus sp. TMH.W2 TaxID=3434465 RepID=UPI003D777C98